jgi:hypothetical protein
LLENFNSPEAALERVKPKKEPVDIYKKVDKTLKGKMRNHLPYDGGGFE